MIINKRIPLYYPFKMIIVDILIISAFATVIHLISSNFIDFKLPISFSAFFGTSISLILSFKLSQSYDRWWEARKIWGAIVNDSRSLVMQLKTFIQADNEAGKIILNKMAYRQISWCYALGQNLRRQEVMKYSKEFISEEEYILVNDKSNIPVMLLDLHYDDLKKLRKKEMISEFHEIQIESTMQRLCTSMGRAERIKNTFFPKTYRLTLRLFIYLFLILLSLSMSNSLSEFHDFIHIPLLIAIAIPFFLLEKIAYQIQDPFENQPTDTAVTSIARTIEINIKVLIEDESIPEPFKPEKFYIM